MMTRRLLVFVLSALLSMTLLAGCGFKLRGSQSNNLEGAAVYLNAIDEYGDVEKIIRRSLQSSGANLTDSEVGVRWVLELLGGRQSRRAVASDGTGRAGEFQVRVTYRYRIVDLNNPSSTDQEPEEIYSAREYAFDRNQLVDQREEEEALISDIERDLAGRILSHFSRTIDAP